MRPREVRIELQGGAPLRSGVVIVTECPLHAAVGEVLECLERLRGGLLKRQAVTRQREPGLAQLSA